MFFVFQFIFHSLDTLDKQHLLTNFVDFASDALTIALNAAKTLFDAIQALELDREWITKSLNKIRVDIFDFQQKYSQFAEEYIAFRNQLNVLAESTERHMNQRYKISQDLKQKIQQIQRLFDFD